MAAPVLQRLEGDVTGLTATAVQKVEDLPKLAEPTEVRASSQLIAVLQAAEKEMAKSGDSYISVGRLLLALAGPDSGVGDLLPEREPLEKAVAEVQGPGH